jgi:exopolyphosphatase/guanosine-5'-triphosphate,3'-diphosphate pyrophosphatase
VADRAADPIAALDVGTNSFHLVVARPVADGFEVVTREKDVVRLGHGAGEMKRLEPEAIERGLAALARLRAVADAHDARIRAVATSAVREARNRADFLERARRETGIDIEVISGVEEARLIHLGVLAATGMADRTFLTCDIGGGSTEIVLARGADEVLARSFKLGAVRLTDRFFPGESLHPAALAACRAHVRSVLAAIRPQVVQVPFDALVVSSGTAETVARLVLRRRREEPPRSINRFEFGATEVRDIVADLARAGTVGARRERFDLEPSRADIILAGAAILEGVCDAFGVDRIVVSDYALREGLILDTLARREALAGPVAGDVAMASVRRLAARCDDHPEHSGHVARLALELFDGLAGRLGLGAEERRWLEAAALLANVGVFVSHARHHLHSYYVIRNSELVGLTDREIEIIAQVARYHRKSAPKADHPEWAALPAADREVVRRLAAILRVAIGLDRTQDGRVKRVTVRPEDGQVVLQVEARRKADLELNLYAAGERRALLGDVLGEKVKLVEV